MAAPTSYESTPRGIDAEGHLWALRPGIQPKLDALRALYTGKKISVGVVCTGGCRGRV
ncbi:hypothetical protein B0H16DRAFT_1524548 [Mycena metata]|uniref:Uncharacterized protein n=1 Tax=Mycena metata TaxID=1033252 RepID=A0AAD7JHU6_9AGAR|nr:hypothetical protein B0H16DRAFT_1524548 [Mycena metata]